MRFLVPLALICLSCVAQTSQAPRAPRRSNAGAPSAEQPPAAVKPEDKCEVQGTVVNAITGEPLNKAHLTLFPIGQPNGVPYATTSDNAGHFLLDDVDPGRYSLSAARNLFVNQSYSPDGNLKRSTTLTLANGQKMKDIVFKLTPQGVVAGRVVDQDGEPLARVQVMCMTFAYRNGKRQPMPGGAGSTNDLGEYRIFGLRPGKYVISATYQSMPQMGMMPERTVGSAQAMQAADEGYATTYYPNSTSTEGASRVEVLPGAQLQGIDMKLVQTRTYRIKGHVAMGVGGQRGVMLNLLSRDGSDFFGVGRRMTRVNDADGTFEMRGVAPGSYYVSAFYNADGVNYSARVPVDVGNANVDGIEVALQPPVEVTGQIAVEANGDLKGSNVRVLLQPKGPNPMMGGSMGGQAKDDLTFKLTNVGRESYDINVYGLPDGFYLKNVRAGSQDVTFSGVDLTQAAAPGDMVVVVNPNGGQVEGTVQNAKSENASGAMVTLIPEEAHRSAQWFYKVASTDQNGHFIMKGVRPGEYKIYAWEETEPGAFMDPEFVKPHESAGKAVSVKENGHETVQLTAIPAEATSTPR